MKIATIKTFALCLMATMLQFSTAFAAESATPDEVYEKLVEAAEVVKTMSPDGDEWIAEFNKKDGEFVWKDSYVTVFKTDGTLVTHPFRVASRGKNVLETKDKNGKLFIKEIMLAADMPNGLWVDYWYPKLGEDESKLYRKISCVVPVEGTNYLVSAGIYNGTSDVAQLNQQLQ